jgi:nicotinamidase-related amidase
MTVLLRARCQLLVIDLQGRLMPAIAEGPSVVAAGRRLVEAARILGVPVAFTEQNPKGLGGTVSDIDTSGSTVFEKSTFDAGAEPGFDAVLDDARPEIVVAGCEAHVCVLQTVLGLLTRGRTVHVVADAVGSRDPENRRAAIERMRAHGASVVTSEMVAFEWLGNAKDPAFKPVLALIK